VQQAEAGQQLGERERDVPRHRVRGDQPRGPVPRHGGERRRAAAGGTDDLLSEFPADHDRMELQRAVQQPYRAGRELKTPLHEVRPAQGAAHAPAAVAKKTARSRMVMRG
jgi:hypothetical protein